MKPEAHRFTNTFSYKNNIFVARWELDLDCNPEEFPFRLLGVFTDDGDQVDFHDANEVWVAAFAACDPPLTFS